MIKEEMLDYLEDYFSETEEHLQNLNDALLVLEKNKEDMEAINMFFRSVHTLKSSSGAMGLEKISNLAHKMEDVLGRLRNEEISANENIMNVLFRGVDFLEKMISTVKERKEEGDSDTAFLLESLGKAMNLEKGQENSFEFKDVSLSESSLKEVESIKVNVKKLDKLMDLVGELLINKMGLEKKMSEYRESHSDVNNAYYVDLKQRIELLGSIVSEMQYYITQTRMLPVSHVFNKFSRLVRDIASQEKKDIDFVIEGGDTELDRTIVDKLGEPLIHLVKNAVDHGIESIEDREAVGKGKGFMKLYAKRNKNKVLIILEDDGRGFDLDLIRRVAVEKEIASEEAISKFTDKQLMALPFLPKFSSKKEVTEISGRGVGLDVVKREIEALHGSVVLETEKGKGSKFILELPLTLAIVPSFIIRVCDKKYAIPILNIVRSIEIDPNQISTVGNEEVIVFEEESISLVRLDNLFNLSCDKENKEKLLLLVVEKGDEKLALVIDEIIDQKEVILKLLNDDLKKISGIAGATILGDGNPALVLDVVTLVE